MKIEEEKITFFNKKEKLGGNICQNGHNSQRNVISLLQYEMKVVYQTIKCETFSQHYHTLEFLMHMIRLKIDFSIDKKILFSSLSMKHTSETKCI